MSRPTPRPPTSPFLLHHHPPTPLSPPSSPLLLSHHPSPLLPTRARSLLDSTRPAALRCEQMYALLALGVALCPQLSLDEHLTQTLKEKFSDRISRMQTNNDLGAVIPRIDPNRPPSPLTHRRRRRRRRRRRPPPPPPPPPLWVSRALSSLLTSASRASSSATSRACLPTRSARISLTARRRCSPSSSTWAFRPALATRATRPPPGSSLPRTAASFAPTRTPRARMT